MRVGVNDLAKANIRTEIKSFHEILRILHTTAKRLRKNSNVVRIFCCGKASYEKKKKKYRPAFLSSVQSANWKIFVKRTKYTYSCAMCTLITRHCSNRTKST